jgi:hypothetical protein
MVGLALEEGIGLPFDSEALITVELHYVTGPEGPPLASDRSGARVCMSSRELPFSVAYSRLGRELGNGTTVTGTCTPTATRPLEIWALRPRLNQLGTSAELVLRRASGDEQVLFGDQVNFNDDELHPLPRIVVNAGDSLRSTCHYLSPRPDLGLDPEDPVCEFHVLHWPAGTLVSGGASDTCLE